MTRDLLILALTPLAFAAGIVHAQDQPRFCVSADAHPFDADGQAFCGTVEKFRHRAKLACIKFEKGFGGTVTSCYADQIDADDAEAAAQRGRTGGQLP